MITQVSDFMSEIYSANNALWAKRYENACLFSDRLRDGIDRDFVNSHLEDGVVYSDSSYLPTGDKDTMIAYHFQMQEFLEECHYIETLEGLFKIAKMCVNGDIPVDSDVYRYCEMCLTQRVMVSNTKLVGADMWCLLMEYDYMVNFSVKDTVSDEILLGEALEHCIEVYNDKSLVWLNDWGYLLAMEVYDVSFTIGGRYMFVNGGSYVLDLMQHEPFYRSEGCLLGKAEGSLERCKKELVLRR